MCKTLYAHFSHHDDGHVVIPGRNWFDYCTTSVPDAQINCFLMILVLFSLHPWFLLCVLAMQVSLSGQELVCSTTSHHV